MTERRSQLIAMLVLALAVVVLDGYWLGRVPVSVTQDEVFLGLNAHAIATSGRGVTGEVLPLYFPMYGSLAVNIWAQPILIYLTALFLKVLPFSEWAIRSPTVLIGVIDAVLMFFIARQIFKRVAWALLAAALFVLTPANFIHSRLAMDYIYPLPFLMGWLLCMTVLIERPRPSLAFLGGALLGLGFYSYIAAIAMMPVYFVIACVLVLKTSARPLKLLVALAAGFLLPLLPAAWWFIHHPAALSGTASRYELVASGPSGTGGLSTLAAMLRSWLHFYVITDRVSLYWYFFNPSYLFLTGGLKVINSTRQFGVFLLPLAILLPLGVNEIVNRRRSPLFVLLLAGLLTAPLAACLVSDSYAIERELELLPFGVLIAMVGAEWLWSEGRLRQVAAVVLLLAIPIQFGFFYRDYFGRYARESAGWFRAPTRLAMEEILARESSSSRSPSIYIDKSITLGDWYWSFYLVKHHREDLLPHTQYADTSRTDWQSLAPGSVVLTPSLEILQK